MKTVTLFRPVNGVELSLIEGSDWRSFPPRLPWQPIFYPVCHKEYALQISEWNRKEFGTGFVVEFDILEEYLSKYQKKIVGSSLHEEYWIPAEELRDFNAAIVGKIRISE